MERTINRFIVNCVEQYAKFMSCTSHEAYLKMKSNNVIDDLINDYEDLHGMSTEYLNDYIQKCTDDNGPKQKHVMNHDLAKSIIIRMVIEMIADEYKMPISEARDKLYNSELIDYIDDDETGLYGESPLYVFSLFEKEMKKTEH